MRDFFGLRRAASDKWIKIKDTHIKIDAITVLQLGEPYQDRHSQLTSLKMDITVATATTGTYVFAYHTDNARKVYDNIVKAVAGA